MTRPDWVAEMRARCAAATPGPWDTQAWGDWFPGQENEQLARSVSFGDEESILVGGGNAVMDAAFIAAARTDLPRALAVIEAADRLAQAADAILSFAPGRMQRYETQDDLRRIIDENTARSAAYDEALAAYRKARGLP